MGAPYVMPWLALKGCPMCPGVQKDRDKARIIGVHAGVLKDSEAPLPLAWHESCTKITQLDLQEAIHRQKIKTTLNSNATKVATVLPFGIQTKNLPVHDWYATARLPR